MTAADRQMLEITRKWLNGETGTSGVSAEIREVSRADSSGRLEVKYHLFVTGAPKDQNYTMVSWPINARGPSALMEGLSLLNDGLISCAGRTPEQCGDPNKIDDPVELTFYPAAGKVFRMALISQDQKTKLFFAIVPDSVAKSDNGCVLEAIRLLPKHELVLLRGKDFNLMKIWNLKASPTTKSTMGIRKLMPMGNMSPGYCRSSRIRRAEVWT